MVTGEEVIAEVLPNGNMDSHRLSAEEMDVRRNENIAYEYLCHLEEAKVWIEACVKEDLPGTTDLEEGLRNGVFLAKLGHFINADIVPVKKIYDRDQGRYQARGLHFRHTDNINHWLKALEDVSLPKIFYPETTDIYDRKNMPRVIYCIHALSLFLFKLGKAPQIQDLYGKIKFTEDEINAMRKELEKYGIQMPAFSKIGGILANEMPVDEAALHAAIIAINEAIDRQVPTDTVSSLQNPAAHLGNIQPEVATTYQLILYNAKFTKAEVARNKSMDPDSSYIPDIYDELLTQAELQGNINKVNLNCALQRVNGALDKRDPAALLSSLRQPRLNLREVKDEFAQFYMMRLIEIRNSKLQNNNTSDEASSLTKDEIQMAIMGANLDADHEEQRLAAIQEINIALDEGDTEKTVRALQNPVAELPPVVSYAASLYQMELASMKSEKQTSLDHEELVAGVQVLSAIAHINQAIDTGNADLTCASLVRDDSHMTNVDESCREKYQYELEESKNKRRANNQSSLLTHFEVQQTVHQVNQQVINENERIVAIGKINEAVEHGDAVKTLASLQLPSAGLTEVESQQAFHYQHLLSKQKEHKAKESHDPSSLLWYEDIQNTVHIANKHSMDGNKLSVAVAAINIAIDTADSSSLLKCLSHNDVFLHSVTPQCAHMYLSRLQSCKGVKLKAGESGGGWMMNRLREGYKFYFSINTMEFAWERPAGVKKDHAILTRDEIQASVAEVTSAYDRQLLFQANEKFIILMQARVRGFLARRAHGQRQEYMYTHLPAVIRIQSWWRMIRQRRKHMWRIYYFKQNTEAAIKLQAAIRSYLAKKKYTDRVNYFKKHLQDIVKIQAFMRSNWAKKDYRALVHGTNPAISVVRRFVHLLDVGDLDYEEEIEVERLRAQLSTDIRFNQQLESDLNQMDIKIGLLVKNRITLQDVISQHKTLKKYRDSSSGLGKGLKTLSKANRERLEAYQHLFYLLQTSPSYLARLIFAMPQSRTTKFMESVILMLYNYASNHREEYLLLKMFKTALEEEIRAKVDKMSDIVTGNPLVVKMIVSYNRNSRGQGALRELLNPLVRNVLDDRNMNINTNPVEVYKQWVNQKETQSGKASGLAYEVTVEQSLQYEEVRNRISASVDTLKVATENFLSAILMSAHLIPYGMRYMARVMKDTLMAKFPEAPEKDVLKIVGNLIYYRYINSAIVAPDAFDIIDVSVSKGLTNDQRRNLGSIAKILQFAASNKGFGGDSAHLSCLNKYIMDAHNRFKQYFRQVCEVEEPEVRFNMDRYTDVTKVTKPVIYISVAEVLDTHKLLLEHQDVIAPDPADSIHELLDDLGEVPDVDTILGDANLEDGGTGATKSQMAKTEISLTLSSKFEVQEDQQADVKSLFIKTKRLVVDVIRCQRSGDNLTEILRIKATPHEEREHEGLIRKRDRIDQKAMSRKAKLTRTQSLVGDTRLPLESMKVKIVSHLKELERAGLVTHHDHFQTVINSLVTDIRNQRSYRQARKYEMLKLQSAMKNLQTKRQFFEEQIDYYNQYVKTCLDNLTTKGKKSGKKQSSKPQKVKGSIKYSAAKLHEKGILLELEDLPQAQFRNVLFEISATENPGVFDVNAKFLGVNTEKLQLVFQDLLQLQYEGVAVMKMFDNARINVNLLIFLLNKKFYGK